MSARSSLQTAQMRRGDFHLRRDDRQLFGNYVILSSIAGTGTLKNLRRSAMFVETPVYDVPKLWRLDVWFDGPAPFASPVLPLTPWVPAGLGVNNVRVTVRHALDRDKQTAVEVFDLQGLTNVPGSQCAMPQRFFAGHQVGVSVECRNPVHGSPVGVQVSLVEVTALDRDPYRNAAFGRFAQSTLSANFLLPNEKRRQFFVTNWGTTGLYVAFDYFAVAPGLTQHYTVALPNRGDVYESPRDCYQGFVSGVWEADGGTAADTAQVTEGF